MRKYIFGLICAFLVVGVANMGQEFPFLGGGGGGGHKSNGSGQSVDVSSLFNFGFHQFGVNPKTGGDRSNSTGSNSIKDFLKLPGLGMTPINWSHDDAGSNFNGSFIGFSQIGTSESDNTDQNSSPVPKPATLILLGSGLMGLGIYGRKRFID